MNCPKCKNKKGKPVRVHPISHRCPKCKTLVNTNHKGKLVIRGVKLPDEKPAPTSTSDA